MKLPAWLKPQPDSLIAWMSHCGRRTGGFWFPVLNLFWLFWMAAAPWGTGRATPQVIGLTYLSMLLFLVLYQRAWCGSRAWLAHYTAAMAVLGLAIIPVNSSWSYVIYAGSLIPFCARGWRVIGWLALLMLLFYWVAIASGFFSPMGAIACVISTSTIALLNLLYRFNFERDVELRLSQDEVRRLAIGAERERIGRDLHDLLGHTLSLVAIKSELARRLVVRDPAGAERELADIERVARQSLAEVREAVTGMRAAALAGELVSARLMLEARDISLEFKGTDVPLTLEAEAALAMGLREAVTNVQRHACATRVEVRLQDSGTGVELSVQDNGRGGVVTPGNGLAGMEERLAALGGRLLLESSPQNGTLLRMQLPRVQQAPA